MALKDSKQEIPEVESRYGSQEETNSALTDEYLTVNVRYKEPDGDVSKLLVYPVTKADYPTIVAWNHVANFVHMYCGQGDLIAVKGRLNTRSYEDPMVKGRKLYITEVMADSIDLLKKADTKPTTPVQQKPAEPWADDIAPEDLPF